MLPFVGRPGRAAGPGRVAVVVADARDRGGLPCTFEAPSGPPGGLLRPFPDTANRPLTLAETEMLRNLDVEFRGNGPPAELYSEPVRNGAVMHMENMCSPIPRDMRTGTIQWAVEAAAATGAGMAERIDVTGVRIIADPAFHEARVATEVAAPALYGALAAAASVPARPARSRSVHRTPPEEPVRVLGVLGHRSEAGAPAPNRGTRNLWSYSQQFRGTDKEGIALHQRCQVNERLRAHMRRRSLTLHCGNPKWDHFRVPCRPEVGHLCHST
ncbi:hypothetical protein [Streptomyces sp. NPDC001348]